MKKARISREQGADELAEGFSLERDTDWISMDSVGASNSILPVEPDEDDI